MHGAGAFCPPRYKTTKYCGILFGESPIKKAARRSIFEVPAPVYKICDLGLTQKRSACQRRKYAHDEHELIGK